MTIKTKFWVQNGWAIWQIIDYNKEEVITKMKYYGRNFMLPKTKEIEE